MNSGPAPVSPVPIATGHQPRTDHSGLGLALMALGVSLFIAIDSSAKWLGLAGIATLQVVFVRYAGHLVFALAWYLPREGRAALHTRHPGLQALRALALLGSTLFNFAALGYLPITVTIAIMFSSPVAVTLLSIPLLHERVGRHRIAAVVIGFAGVLVVAQPWGAEFHPAMLLSLCAMLSGAFYLILTRMMAGRERNSVSQVWASGMASLVMAPVALPLWIWPATLLQAAVMTMIGVFGAVAHILLTAAHRHAEASLLAPVIYVQIPLAALSGILIFDTWPTVWTGVGTAIIVVAGLYIWHRERLRAAVGK